MLLYICHTNSDIIYSPCYMSTGILYYPTYINTEIRIFVSLCESKSDCKYHFDRQDHCFIQGWDWAQRSKQKYGNYKGNHTAKSATGGE